MISTILVLQCLNSLQSGHGFKLAPVVGKLLCEMTMDLPLSYDITPFAVNRFKK